jgi:hypothetical protein
VDRTASEKSNDRIVEAPPHEAVKCGRRQWAVRFVLHRSQQVRPIRCRGIVESGVVDAPVVKLGKIVVVPSTRESFPASEITCAVDFCFPPLGRDAWPNEAGCEDYGSARKVVVVGKTVGKLRGDVRFLNHYNIL